MTSPRQRFRIHYIRRETISVRTWNGRRNTIEIKYLTTDKKHENSLLVRRTRPLFVMRVCLKENSNIRTKSFDKTRNRGQLQYI